jgi:hypothetical protein
MKKIPTLLDLYEAIRPKYTIFCDMDGVLCDFDEGYKNETKSLKGDELKEDKIDLLKIFPNFKKNGISTDEANALGKSYFWKIFRKSVGENEKEFWANLEWQPGGKELWGYIEKYKPNILSSPAIDFNLPQDQQLNPDFNQAIQGKKMWIAKNLSNVGKEIFVPAVQKSAFAKPNRILIDDMQKNIDAWNAAGGEAILHTSTTETLTILKEKYSL